MKVFHVKIFLFIIIFLNVFYFSNTFNSFAQAVVPNNKAVDRAEEGISELVESNGGLIDCNTMSSGRKCTPADLFVLLKKLGKIMLYITIIFISVVLVYYGSMYPFKGDNVEWLNKAKKNIKSIVIAIVVLVFASGGVLTLLAYLSDKTGGANHILEFIQKLLSQNIIETSYAQDAKVDIPVAETKSGPGGSIQHVNFFGTTNPLLLLNNIISFLVKYIFIPMSIIAIIWTGFLFVKAQGNEEEIRNAKKWAFRSVIGILVVSAASFITNIIFNSLQFLLDK